MNDVRLKLSPPWVTYINKLEALFDGDPQIAFNIDYDNMTVALAGNNGEKNAALQRLLPTEKQFGNITLKVIVDGPIANIAFPTQKDLFDCAFKGNPAYAYSVTPGDEVWFFNMTYVVFKNCVVQFFNDNLNDCHGLLSTLYQDIAAEIFEDANLINVHYNTDIEVGKLGMPLGEWP